MRPGQVTRVRTRKKPLMSLESSREHTEQEQPGSVTAAETGLSPVVQGGSEGEQPPERLMLHLEAENDSTTTEPEELLAQVITWLQMPDWETSQTYLETHPRLLTYSAEQILEALKSVQGNEQAQAMIVIHQTLLQEARGGGIQAAYQRFLAPELEIRLSDQEQGQLLCQLEEWIMTPDWRQSQMYLETHPGLLTEAAEDLLASLQLGQQTDQVRTTLGQHQQLLRRTREEGITAAYQAVIISEAGMAALSQYWTSGQLADLNRAVSCMYEALNLTTPDSPVRPALLNNLALGLRDRYAHTRALADLEAAINAYEQAILNTPPDSPDLPGLLSNLGNALRDQYNRTGELADLESTINAFQQAARTIPPNLPDQRGYLNNLGIGLRDRYYRTGELADLEAAINAFQQAIHDAPPDSPVRLALFMSNLGGGLRDRYAHTGVLADLESAINAYEQAILNTPPDLPDLPGLLNNLGNGLNTRYNRTGELADLEAAITAYRKAVQDIPPDSPARPSLLSNLGNALADRYACTGELADLEAAISSSQQAVQSTPLGSPDLPRYLNNLGSELHYRYYRIGELADLEAAISSSQQAIQAALPDSPNLPGYLSNLGSGLLDRYAHTGELADLEAAISSSQQAVKITTLNSPARPALLDNLGIGLHSRYARTGEPADLEAAINAVQQAIQDAPLDSPARSNHLRNLGSMLHNRYARTGEPADLEAAINAVQQAIQGTPSDSPDQLALLQNLGIGLRDRYDHSREPADLEATISAWERCWSIQHPHFADLPVSYQFGQQRQEVEIAAHLVTAHLEQSQQRHPRSASAPRRTLEIAEGSKSRLLTRMVGRGPLPLPSGLSPEIAAREQQLLTKLTSLDTLELAIYGHLSHSQEKTSPLQRLQQRQAALHELEDLWAYIAGVGLEGTVYVALRLGAASTWQEFARLTKALGPATALLSFFTTTDRALLFLLRDGWRAPRVVEVSLNQNVWVDLLERFFREVHRYEPGLRRSQTWDRPLLPLLTEAQHHLEGVERLLLAPAGHGHLLPWAVLVERAGWHTSAGQPMSLVTLPALGILPRLRQRPHAPPGPALVIGNPRGDLPYAEDEANAVAERFGTKPLLGASATKSAVLTRLPEATLIHLATHAFFDGNNPLESGIILSEGVLTAREVLQHRLHADLLVLSACESGQVGSLGGEELAGLSQAFLQTGVRSLLVSLWKVNDPATAALMQAFYTARQAGADKALALRQAMTQIQQDPRWSHPYYWGAFVLVGDWD
jgi:CHAT domain/Tetratricopeptide repeat